MNPERNHGFLWFDLPGDVLQVIPSGHPWCAIVRDTEVSDGAPDRFFWVASIDFFLLVRGYDHEAPNTTVLVPCELAEGAVRPVVRRAGLTLILIIRPSDNIDDALERAGITGDLAEEISQWRADAINPGPMFGDTDNDL